jgi:hypothetical protein
MAKLHDFLGGLASSITDARVNADMQSLRIAEEYAKDDILKHFSVPRMRIDSVELHIPVAVDQLKENSQKVYKPINKAAFTQKIIDQILAAFPSRLQSAETTKKLDSAADSTLKPAVEIRVNTLDSALKHGQSQNSIDQFSKDIASVATEFFTTFSKENGINMLSRDLKTMLTTLPKELDRVLNENIVFEREKISLDSIDVIVESHKLREINPQHIITIKMTLSEQGMEWVNMENQEGKVVNRLLPE